MNRIEGGRFGRTSAPKGWLEAKWIEYCKSLTAIKEEVSVTPKKLSQEDKLKIGSNLIRYFRDLPDTPDAHDHNLSDADTKDGANSVPDWAQH